MDITVTVICVVIVLVVFGVKTFGFVYLPPKHPLNRVLNPKNVPGSRYPLRSGSDGAGAGWHGSGSDGVDGGGGCGGGD